MTPSHPVKREHPVVAAFYDAYMWPQELMGFRRQRERMAGEATGRVLELAAGTGLTFPFYVHAEEVVAIDSDPSMLKRARRRAATAPCPVRLLQANAESLPFHDGEFDTVVLAFGLCTIPHPETAVHEAHRVLKPDGRLLFLEHVRSHRRLHARLQDLAAPVWSGLAGGCYPNRRSVDTIGRHFDVDRLWRKGIIVQGSARRARPQSSAADSLADARPSDIAIYPHAPSCPAAIERIGANCCSGLTEPPTRCWSSIKPVARRAVGSDWFHASGLSILVRWSIVRPCGGWLAWARQGLP